MTATPGSHKILNSICMDQGILALYRGPANSYNKDKEGLFAVASHQNMPFSHHLNYFSDRLGVLVPGNRASGTRSSRKLCYSNLLSAIQP
jgi:hypothetical protein